jgi:DNA polymerase-3 subunit alpha
VKGLGESAAEAVLTARRRVGRFRSLAQMIAEVDLRCVNLKVFETLIKSGACDVFGQHRAALAAALERTVDWSQRRRRAEEAGQGSLFAGDSHEGVAPAIDDSVPPWPEEDRLRAEKEALGFFLTGNPLAPFEARLRALTSHSTRELREGFQGEATVGGLVTRIKRAKIKSGPNAGKVMGRFVLEDLSGSLNVTLFVDALRKYEALLVEDAALVVRGTVRERGGEHELSAEELIPLERAARRLVTGVRVALPGEASKGLLVQLRDLLADHPGEASVKLVIRAGSGEAVEIEAGERLRVDYTAELAAALERLVGVGNVERLGL